MKSQLDAKDGVIEELKTSTVGALEQTLNELKVELQDANCRTEGFQKELNQTLVQLQETREQLKKMTVDKHALEQE